MAALRRTREADLRLSRLAGDWLSLRDTRKARPSRTGGAKEARAKVAYLQGLEAVGAELLVPLGRTVPEPLTGAAAWRTPMVGTTRRCSRRWS